MTSRAARHRNFLQTFLLTLGLLVFLAGCASQKTVRKQYLEFEQFTVVDGVYKPKPGWTFTPGKDDTTVVVARANDSIIITPCECALETGGSCSQASRDGPDGDIAELWCVDNNCGFCVGGTVDPEDPSASVRFDVVCLENREASRD